MVAISSFYRWCVRRNKIQYHPFNDKIDRVRVTPQDKVRKRVLPYLEADIYSRNFNGTE